MDLKKLANISDSKFIAKTNKRVVDQSSVLDDLVLDKSKRDEKSSKLVFISDSIVKNFSKLPREKKRVLLSKLSDSNRRILLNSVKRIKDSDSELNLILCNSLLTNFAFTNSEFDRNQLSQFLNNYNEYPELVELGNKLLDGEFSLENDSSLLDKALDVFDENNVKSELRLAIGSTYANSTDLIQDCVNMSESIKQVVFEEGYEMAESPFNSLSEFLNEIDAKIASFIQLGYDYDDIYNTFVAGYDKCYKQQQDYEVMDSIVDKIAENLEGDKTMGDLDGDNSVEDENSATVSEEPSTEPVEPSPEINSNSILLELSEALLEYANGNDSKLKMMAISNVKGEVSTAEEVPANIVAENPDDDKETLVDCINFVKQIKTKKFDSVLYNKMKSKLGFKFDLIYDDHNCEFEQTNSVIEAPLTRDEFCSVNETPGYIVEMTNSDYCPEVNNCIEKDGYVCVNPETIAQLWIPKTGTAVEFITGLQKCPQDTWSDEILDKCVSLQDAYKTAAKTNNLSFIDNKFYKQKLSKSYWTVSDNISWCPTLVKGTKVFPNWVKQDGCKTISIYGTTYKYMN